MTGVGKARGILRRQLPPEQMMHWRVAPDPALAFFVEHFWMVRWDLPDHPPQLQETLPHPNVHLVVEAGQSGIYGVHTRRYSRLLEGRGRAFGVKFRPAGFQSFLRKPLSNLANCHVAIDAVFGDAGRAIERALLDSEDTALVPLAEAFFQARRPTPDTVAESINDLVARIARTPSMTTVASVLGHTMFPLRQLQRHFRHYVGVSPKWVINRYRLHEAVERLANASAADWTRLAHDLGYFDQAHFIRDFKRLTGRTPGAFVRAEGKRR
ncbi:AraC family transcriptional regulator [Tahibacter amnicola]|uniref:AraC family transcriptional regulator n=1 Tax=Tahibacter amnicola TaxID=2976241 RepID=A0ABY6BDE2_9GAMM|nr:helix-turn-helix domain-containing protein [Tahibacter amnicola]UXI66355.1 AraC family transcriptional regulator [Tahibacter amnicola]